MTGQKPEGVSTDIELLPLPAEDYVDDEGLWEKRHGPYSHEQMEDYARANVAHAAAAKDAEIERLRAEREVIGAEAIKYAGKSGRLEARAERLAEALRPLAGLDLRPDGFDKRDDSQPVYARDKSEITVGDVRRAVAALRDHDKEGGDA